MKLEGNNLIFIALKNNNISVFQNTSISSFEVSKQNKVPNLFNSMDEMP